MAAIRAKLSLLQRIGENFSWEEFSRACSEEKGNLGDINVKDVKLRNVKIDFYSQQLIPADELTEFVPLDTLGDGSCFFRSISKQIYGDESLHEELRLRAIVELALNESYYLSDEELCDRIRAQERTLRGNGAESIDPVMLMTVFREEVKATCNLSTYASFWHLQAIANVLKRKIKSVYPETTPEVRQYFHCIIIPRQYDNTKPPLAVLWSNTKELSTVELQQYRPNHFVPLVSRNNFYTTSDDEMWRCFPCPHSDCMLSQTWYQDLKSHYRVAHGQVLCDNEAKSEQKRRRQEAMLQKVFLLSSKIVGGEVFKCRCEQLEIEIRETTHYNAAFKVAYVLMAGGKLSTYSHSVGWKVIVADGKTKNVMFYAWKIKDGEREVPEIETKRTIQKTFQDEQLIISQELCAVSSSTLPSSVSESTLAIHSPNQEFQLSLESLTDILQAKWGIQSLKKEQEKAMQAVLERKDCFVSLPTGGGKSLIYQLPAYRSNGITVVITPLKSLMNDQIKQCADHGLLAVGLHGEMQDSEKQGLYFSLKQTSCLIKVLLVTAEMISENKVLLEILNTLYSRKKLSLFVVDECHCVSKWGHQFRDSYLGLGKLKLLFPSVPMLLLTATATKSTREDVMGILKLNNPVVIAAPMNRENITYSVKEKTSQTVEEIFRMTVPVECSLVFCNTRNECEELSPKLQAKGLKCKFYHGGMDDNLRTEIQSKWIDGSLQCLVCTNAFGMGINKPNVSLVIHFSIPASLEDMCQETGRAGRDGLPASSVLYYSHQNQVFHVRNIYERMRLEPSLCENQIQCYNHMMYYAIQKGECRRTVMLRYFGEAAPCHEMCDICQNPESGSFKEQDITEIAKKAVLCVQRVTGVSGQSKFTLHHFAKILTGKKVKHNHDQLPEYGCMKTPTNDGVFILQVLVSKNILREVPPDKSSKNRNALYLTLGPSFVNILSGSLTVSCKF